MPPPVTLPPSKDGSPLPRRSRSDSALLRVRPGSPYAMMGTYTEPTTGITITTKVWDGNDGNYHIWAGVGFGIAVGQAAALTILKSA